MCGIHGFNFSESKLIEAMVRRTHHRGPDDEGIFTDGQMSLGNNRLAILDLSPKGHQPMRSRDQRKVIVFNGEIYNFREIRADLEKQGIKFVSQSDTEVILAAYEYYGLQCFELFDGIFALAIWDRSKNQLVLARDHLGVKPLYYYFEKGKLIFSSEIKAILEHPLSRTLDRDALNHYLRVLYVPEPRTMFAGIKKLPPASYALFQNGKLEITKYWQPPLGHWQEGRDRQEIVRHLRDQVLQAVKRQLISDRPLGVYLSGGIDSSIVLAAAAQVLPSRVETFSVGFALSDKEQAQKFNADFLLARQTARQFGTNHHELLLHPTDLLQDFEKLVYHLDEPISNPTALAMFKLSEFVKPRVTVALSGDGGDELFAGYPRYRLALLAWYFQKLPISLRKLLSRLDARFAKLNTPPGLRQYELFGFLAEDRVRALLDPEAYQDEVTAKFFAERYFARLETLKLHPVEKLMEVTRQSWLPDYALMLADKMSMAHSIEVRVPLLDPRVVEFAATIPWRFKLSLLDTKIIFKEAFADLIPEHLLREPKRGWFSPGAKWLRYPEVAEFARQVLRPDYYAQTARLFNFANLETLLTKHLAGEYHLTELWAILTFQIWARHYQIKL